MGRFHSYVNLPEGTLKKQKQTHTYLITRQCLVSASGLTSYDQLKLLAGSHSCSCFGEAALGQWFRAWFRFVPLCWNHHPTGKRLDISSPSDIWWLVMWNQSPKVGTSIPSPVIARKGIYVSSADMGPKHCTRAVECDYTWDDWPASRDSATERHISQTWLHSPTSGFHGCREWFGLLCFGGFTWCYYPWWFDDITSRGKR